MKSSVGLFSNISIPDDEPICPKHNCVKPQVLSHSTRGVPQLIRIGTNFKRFIDLSSRHAYDYVIHDRRNHLALPDHRGTRWWEHNYDCTRVFREPARGCCQHISDDLKAAQVNSEGKRAEFLGWKRQECPPRGTYHDLVGSDTETVYTVAERRIKFL